MFSFLFDVFISNLASILCSLLVTLLNRTQLRPGSHSTDQSGGAGETLPRHVQQVQEIDECLSSLQSTNAQTIRARQERTQNERSTTGAMPPPLAVAVDHCEVKPLRAASRMRPPAEAQPVSVKLDMPRQAVVGPVLVLAVGVALALAAVALALAVGVALALAAVGLALAVVKPVHSSQVPLPLLPWPLQLGTCLEALGLLPVVVLVKAVAAIAVEEPNAKPGLVPEQ